MRLFLCEKPSQGRDIGAVLGATRRGEGFLAGSGVTVTWAVGHLLENAAPEAYGARYGKPWSLAALPIIPDSWKVTVKKETEHQFRVIASLLKQVDEVVIATDADREGEVIARELLEHCRWDGPVSRLWLGALDELSIRAALAAIQPGSKTERLYHAGLGRARADWLIGMNLSRLYTLKARDMGYNGVLSVGRVQTPTLSLIVRRDREIASFVPRPYWLVMVQLQAGGITFPARWVPASMYTDEEKRCIHQNIALQVAQLCRQTGQATVIECDTRREKESAPLAFSLGTLQRACGRMWNMSPQQVLDIAQSLYEKHKATTYPRTDCGYLPVSMKAEISSVLDAVVKSDPSVASLVSQLDTAFSSRIWNDKKITAHHGIIPTRVAFQISALSEPERKVYELIRRHYFAQFLPLHETDLTRLSFNIGGQLFQASGRVVIVQGWKVLSENDPKDDGVNGESNNEEQVSLPALKKDDHCAVASADIRELQTRPPEHYTFDTLIAAMMNAASFVTDLSLRKVLKETAGLGTEATRSGIIEQLLVRGFIVQKGKKLLATDVACDLIDALPVQLTEPGMTALWEQALDEVAAGRMQLADFLHRQVNWTRQLVQQGQQQQLKIRIPPSPSCPLCGGKTQLRQGKKGEFWGCQRYPECKGIISADSGGKKARGKGKPGKRKQN